MPQGQPGLSRPCLTVPPSGRLIGADDWDRTSTETCSTTTSTLRVYLIPPHPHVILERTIFSDYPVFKRGTSGAQGGESNPQGCYPQRSERCAVTVSPPAHGAPGGLIDGLLLVSSQGAVSVLGTGFEPVRPFGHRHLKSGSLPFLHPSACTLSYDQCKRAVGPRRLSSGF